MKRRGYIFEQITDIDNLRLAFCKAKQGKSAKKDVLLFCENTDSNLLSIRDRLMSGNYRFGMYHYFTIYDPKRRVICAASFEERIIHHAIMNICSAHFENYQIPASYACRKSKGTFAAVKKAAYYQKKYTWYLKLDIRKYFDSIDHEILSSKLQRMYKDKRLLDTFWRIIDSYHVKDGKGVPIGNLTSQYFANHYLSFADKYATEQLRILAYVRYMDDMLLWADNKTELMEKGTLFEHFIIQNLKLSLKPFVMNKTEHGLPALGFMLYPNQIRLNRRSKKRFATKLTAYTALLDTGNMSEKQFARRVLSLYGFISHANSTGFIKHILQESGLDAKGSNRVNRGGSWNNNARNVRVPNRNNNSPGNRNNNLGFRLACSTKQLIDFEQVSISLPEKG
ncbi:RNA-directed DNA polymerase [Dysgonomonas termitidis]|uniref:Reverse transcriptase domain-containing protein n=1 Tax=Dysgonomonas termitidis TaxID=1516126 RepID=A0ABV9L090_9BACT